LFDAFLEHFEDFYKFCQIGGEKQVCCDLKMIEKKLKKEKRKIVYDKRFTPF
jgi:hypothetical protein